MHYEGKIYRKLKEIFGNTILKIGKNHVLHKLNFVGSTL